MKYMVSSEEKPQNFPIYAVHSDMDSYILFNDDTCPTIDSKILPLKQNLHTNEESVAQSPGIMQSIDEVILKDKLHEKTRPPTFYSKS